jgi:hypothetical protein
MTRPPHHVPRGKDTALRRLALAAVAAGLWAVAGGGDNLAAARAPGPAAAALPEPARTVLARYIKLGPDEERRLLAGEIVARPLDSVSSNELAGFGVMRMAISTEFFFDRYRDVVRFKKHEAVRQIGRFSDPPRVEDVQSLTFEPDELDEVRHCSPGDCKVKLDTAAMASLRGGSYRARPAGADDVQAQMRRLLVNYVTGYLVRGDAALVEYADRKAPVRLADEFRSIVSESPYLSQVFPGVADALVRFPQMMQPALDSFVYWSKESFGFKPIVSITHVTVFRDARQPHVLIGASKQLYASHYLEASLGVTLAVDAGTDPGNPSMYLVYVNQSRVDGFRGMFGGLRRAIARSRVGGGIQQTMRGLRQRLEQEAAAARR